MINEKARSATKNQVLNQAQAHSLQAEQAIIGALLDQPQKTYELVSGKLQADHFFDPFCKLVYKNAIELIADDNSPDIIMLAARIDGYVDIDVDQIEEMLTEIYDRYPTSNNAQGWSSIILDKFVQRGIDKTGERLRDLSHAQNFSAEDKIVEATRMISEVSASIGSDMIATTKDLIFHTRAQIEDRMNSTDEGPAGLSFGFEDLDEATTGMHGAELIVVAGRPGMGKTAFAMAMAQATAAQSDISKRKGVLMFSLEMSHEQMGMRWISTVFQIPVKNMRSGRVSAEEAAILDVAMETADEYPFYVDKHGSVTAEKVCSIARQVSRERGLALVVVDYLQLLSSSSRSNANRSEVVGEMSRALKNLSRELGIPVVALSQLNRSVEQRQDKRPMMSDLRESGSIEQDADVIMFLYRDDYYNKNSTEPGIAEIIVAKQRNGATQTVKLGWNGPLTSFYSINRNSQGGTTMKASASVSAAYEKNDAPF